MSQRPVHAVAQSIASAHRPARHWTPAAHATPHAPQFEGSLCTSTQPPLHDVEKGHKPPPQNLWSDAKRTMSMAQRAVPVLVNHSEASNIPDDVAPPSTPAPPSPRDHT